MNEQVEGQLTLFPEDSRASHSPLPGSKEARKMTATSGRKWLGLSKNSAPLGSLEKMLLESLEWHSQIFYLSWKPVGIGQGHFLFQLALSEPDIDDTESQLWATPNTMDYLPQRSPEALKRQANGIRKGRKRPANLREQVDKETVRMWEEPKMYNTPTAQDAKNSTLPKSQIKRDSLVGDVMREKALFQTPTTGAGMCGGTGNFRQLKKLKEQGVISEDERRNMSQGNGGQLNPYWVEWLMGFPTGWTEI